MCVCASEHKFGVATNHGKLRCDWVPMSNIFYLLRHIKNGLEPKIGSGVRLCMGKVLGTPRHPLKMVTSLIVFLYVCLAWMLI